MSKTVIFGHKNPDTDTIVSAIVLANLERKLGNDVQAVRLGELNKETEYVLNYFKENKPELIENTEELESVILVDHNEFNQSIEGIENVTIKKVVDHHRIQNFNTAEPLYYRAEPLGSTATVIYKLYIENNIEIEPNIAGLMLSAIISDTLLFKSPTCTDEDRQIAKKLGEIANVNVEEYGLDMLKAGTNLGDYSAAKLITLDSKEFSMNSSKVEIAQIGTASIPDILERIVDIKFEMKKTIEAKNLDLFLVAITDIINNNSELVALGSKSALVEKAYDLKLNDDMIFVEGLVSRKKQIIPVLTKVFSE